MWAGVLESPCCSFQFSVFRGENRNFRQFTRQLFLTFQFHRAIPLRIPTPRGRDPGVRGVPGLRAPLHELLAGEPREQDRHLDHLLGRVQDELRTGRDCINQTAIVNVNQMRIFPILFISSKTHFVILSFSRDRTMFPTT